MPADEDGGAPKRLRPPHRPRTPTGTFVRIARIYTPLAPTVTLALKRLVRAAALSAVLLLTLSAPAEAAAPCWKLLITDWYDGTINKSYPIPCYRQAIDHLPTDARLYSNARDDILRAMQLEIAAQNAATTPTTTAAAAPVTTAPVTTASEPPPPPPPPPATTTEPAVVVPPTTTSPGRKKPKGVAKALDELNPGDADEFPLPLLILGGLAILLVAAGIGGMIWRRRSAGPGPA